MTFAVLMYRHAVQESQRKPTWAQQRRGTSVHFEERRLELTYGSPQGGA